MENQNQYSLKPIDVIFPILFVLILWVVEFIEFQNDVSFSEYGLVPRSFEGLRGIILSPFIHDDWEHLTNNSVPLVILGIGIFYFFRKVALNIYLGSIFITGIWVWVFARPSYHIGASGMVYTFASFIFWIGFFSRYYRLIALSLLVVFLYGGMVWGVLPYSYRISWESHLMGVLSGLLLAYFHRHHGPKPKTYDWETEEEQEDDDDSGLPWRLPEEGEKSAPKIIIKYQVKPSKPKEKPDE